RECVGENEAAGDGGIEETVIRRGNGGGPCVVASDREVQVATEIKRRLAEQSHESALRIYFAIRLRVGVVHRYEVRIEEVLALQSIRRGLRIRDRSEERRVGKEWRWWC